MQIQRLVRLFAVIAAIAGASLASFANDAMPDAVAQALRAAGVPSDSAAIVVQDVSAAFPLLAVNPSTPMNPASTMKLVTTYAGLELLGPAYRWRTEAYLSGPLHEGVLQGDLVLKGYGDPKLTLEAFWLLLRSLRARGLRDIRGDLLLDRSYFATSQHDPSRFDGEGLRPYNVGSDALLLNFKSIRFVFSTDAQQAAPRVTAEPRIVEVISELRFAEGACGDWRARLKADFRTQSAPLRAVFTGGYPTACGERDWRVALLTPNAYAEGVFRLLWGELGGTITGTARDGAPLAQSKPFVFIESPALAEVVRDINKYSNNVMARQLYLTLAAQRSGAPGTEQNGQGATKVWLAKKGLDFPELVMENGAGLSRTERISALSLTTLLVAAFRSAVMPELAASLPLVAVDGTMRRRMKSAAIAGQAHIKTGTLADARAIAGFVLDRSGRRHAVTMIVNHPNAAQTQAAQDALLNWIYELNGGSY